MEVKCRCGKKHDTEAGPMELEKIIRHQCFHDKGIRLRWGFGPVAECVTCGMPMKDVQDPEGTTYPCPVCLYQCRKPCQDNYTCPCCNTVFDDSARNCTALRADWIAEGTPWKSKTIVMPTNWNPWFQLAKGWGQTTKFVVERDPNEELAEMLDRMIITPEAEVPVEPAVDKDKGEDEDDSMCAAG